MAKSQHAQGWNHAKTLRPDPHASSDLHLRQSRFFNTQIGPARLVQAENLQRRENHLRLHRHPGRGRDLPDQHAGLPIHDR